MSLLMEALGTADESFLEGLLQQLAMVAGPEGDERGLNFTLALVKGVEPKDQVEAMLAAQMAAVHLLTVLSKPYEDQPVFSRYADPPPPDQVVHQTFCGT